MIAETSDDGFMERLCQGERSAWREAFVVLRKAAFRTARGHPSLRLSVADAEEVTMEAVREIIDADLLVTVEAFENLRRLVVVVALRRGIDFVRRNTSGKRGSGQVGSLEILPEENMVRLEALVTGDHRRQVELADYLEILAGLLESELGERERGLVRDYYLKGLSHREIAEDRGIPIGGIGVTLKRATEKLKAGLHARGIGPKDFFSR